MEKVFVYFFTFYHNFRSLQKLNVRVASRVASNDLILEILENWEIPKKSLKCLELLLNFETLLNFVPLSTNFVQDCDFLFN